MKIAPVCVGQIRGESNAGVAVVPGEAGTKCTERMTGIEPAPSVWKTEALPLSYIREVVRREFSGKSLLLKNLNQKCAVCKRQVNFQIDLLRLFRSGRKAWRSLLRDVAQFGSAPVLGTGGCRFKSCHPDSYELLGQSRGREPSWLVEKISIKKARRNAGHFFRSTS